ncbi:MAG: FmdB family transcriptional regulator [Armatimonadetes bacterium]|nr:FmdB family transcriptional regulator [Armatimonadota bacterium]
MPIYEYRCTQCHHQFECTQPVGAPAPACPQCGRSPRRVYTSVGLIFKGSGFHTTDYRKPASSDGASPEGAKPDASKPDASKSDAATTAGSSSPTSGSSAKTS